MLNVLFLLVLWWQFYYHPLFQRNLLFSGQNKHLLAKTQVILLAKFTSFTSNDFNDIIDIMTNFRSMQRIKSYSQISCFTLEAFVWLNCWCLTGDLHVQQMPSNSIYLILMCQVQFLSQLMRGNIRCKSSMKFWEYLFCCFAQFTFSWII